MMESGKIMKSDDVHTRLISLIDNKKTIFHGGISEIVRKEFELIEQARENQASWSEIVATLGFDGKEDSFTLAFWREKKRRAKKTIAPDKKGKSVIPDVKPGIRPDPAVRVGLPRPIGRGRLDLGEDTPPGEI